MKKFFLGLFAALALIPTVKAQQIPQLPADEAVVKGTLPNGLTYYIRHNEYPKGQADFHIAQKVGSVLEEDNQRGLAHFLEHMCFNGTKNFPGNSLISYLESIGVKFGSHLNAYTGTDETVYKITNVPTARPEVTDSVLLILHDWANELLLEPEEIDKERGVIHEEWRSSNVGQMRILEQLMPKIYPGSRYAERLPIGTMEVVDNFPYQALRDYYEAWYRPDLQGIIVCGDIDVARTEQVIKQMFSDIEMPANAAERTSFPVPDTPGTIYAVGADKEMTNSIVYLMFKHEVTPVELRNTPVYLGIDYVSDLIDIMLNARFSDMMSNPDTPFAVAQAMVDNYMMSNTEDALTVIGAAKDGDIVTTLKSIYREVLRAARGGFTYSEFERAKANWMAQLEQQYNNRNTQENSYYTEEMIRSFIDGTPMMSLDDTYEIMQQFSQMVDLNAINTAFKELVTDDNRVVLCMLPESVKIPTEEELAKAMAEVDAEEIEAFKDDVREDPLIPSLPAAGKIVSTNASAEFFENTEALTLSNGATVYLKQTPFKTDEVLMVANAPGGLSRVLNQLDPVSVRTIEIFAPSYAIGAYTSTDLEKYLVGKQVSLQPSFELYSTEIEGSTTPKDLPTLMELLYGYFTSVNYPEKEFSAVQSLYYGLVQNQEANPEFIFRRDANKSFYTSPYQQIMTADDVKSVSREGIEKLVKSQLTDASEWSFTFVGNFDPEQIKSLCEKYIATLPSTNQGPKRVRTADPSLVTRPGKLVDTYTTKMETPQTWVFIKQSGNVPYNSRNAKLVSIVGQILSARLLKTIREEMGAVYSIGAGGMISAPLGLNANIVVPFPMNPDQKETVLAAIQKEFEDMAQNITEEELSKVKEFLVKSYIERSEQNAAWAGYISNWYLTGSNNIKNAVEIVNALTPADVQNFVKMMNDQGNYHTVILDPANE
ncbi:MAG: insulinase family protein [Muribaculaceae bacterium]|nr:insulinase family protein [Muribaculaceae bacterium]